MLNFEELEKLTIKYRTFTISYCILSFECKVFGQVKHPFSKITPFFEVCSPLARQVKGNFELMLELKLTN